MGQQLRLGPVGVEHRGPPGALPGREPARQGRRTGPGDVPGRHLRLPGERGEHHGVRGEQHGGGRHRQLVRHPVQRFPEVVRAHHPVLGDAADRIAGPPRDRGASTGGQHPAPVRQVRFPRRAGRADHGLPPSGVRGCRRGPDQCRADDDVVDVVAGGPGEGATAGDQAQFRDGHRPVHAPARELALAHPLGGADLEQRDAVGPLDLDPVAGPQVVQPVEHARARPGVDVAGDDRRSDLARHHAGGEPARHGGRLGWDQDAGGVDGERHQLVVDTDGRDAEGGGGPGRDGGGVQRRGHPRRLDRRPGNRPGGVGTGGCGGRRGHGVHRAGRRGGSAGHGADQRAADQHGQRNPPRPARHDVRAPRRSRHPRPTRPTSAAGSSSHPDGVP